MKKFFLTIFLASCATKPDATISSKLHQPTVGLFATPSPFVMEIWFGVPVIVLLTVVFNAVLTTTPFAPESHIS